MHRLALASVASLILLAPGVIPASQASEKDLAGLSRLLTPAYTAMSFANLCAMEAEWWRSQPVGKLGTAMHYAQHVKDEVITALTYEEALVVLKDAADKARTEARRQLRANVLGQDPQTEAERFKAWCDSHVTPFIVEFIEQHELAHASFLEEVARLAMEK